MERSAIPEPCNAAAPGTDALSRGLLFIVEDFPAASLGRPAARVRASAGHPNGREERYGEVPPDSMPKSMLA